MERLTIAHFIGIQDIFKCKNILKKFLRKKNSRKNITLKYFSKKISLKNFYEKKFF